ncbi:PP2C family protein-serine/threonine phosphatase [Streptomyces sp. NPDC046985]|uniref:PP2C family protein-serine/threonine phosphatase n=1 Tax=Streptomyces sp. NPDC046985 TaxID=3155377 RepID=UPI0033F97215
MMIRTRAGTPCRMRPGALALAVGTGLFLHARRSMLHELRQARAVAGAAQSALLRPLPPRLAGLCLAAAQCSADQGAAVGGDLYEAVATEHGVRVVIGDVRGHGLAALGTVAAVLGSFREAAHDEAELTGVLRRLDRALARHLRTRHPERPAAGDAEDAEDFVTVLLLEIAADGALRALNCGHPWPYRLAGGKAAPVARTEPLPPLGLFPLPSDLAAENLGGFRPGQTLVLYTDGVEDARDARGRFFPLGAVLSRAARRGPVSSAAVLRAVFAPLLRHTGHRLADDAAVLVLHNDRQPADDRDPTGDREPAYRRAPTDGGGGTGSDPEGTEARDAAGARGPVDVQGPASPSPPAPARPPAPPRSVGQAAERAARLRAAVLFEGEPAARPAS